MSFYEGREISEFGIKVSPWDYIRYYGTNLGWVVLLFFGFGEILKKTTFIEPNFLNFSIAFAIIFLLTIARFPNFKEKTLKEKSRIPILKKYGDSQWLEVTKIQKSLQDLRLNVQKIKGFQTIDEKGVERKFEIGVRERSILDIILKNTFYIYEAKGGKKEWLEKNFEVGKRLHIKINPENRDDFVFTEDQYS